MEEKNLDTNEIKTDDSNIIITTDCISEESISNNIEQTSPIVYREIEEPCVALTIIGENRLTTSVSIIKHGFKFSMKAFFSSIVLTVMNLFI